MEAARASSEANQGGVCTIRPPSFTCCAQFLNERLIIRSDDEYATRLLRTACFPVPACAQIVPDVKITRRDAAIAVEQNRTVSMYGVAQTGRFGAAFIAVRDLFADFCVRAADGTAFYGATGALNHNGFVLFGETTAGKTLLLLHLVSLGARFLGDETFALDCEQARVRAFPRHPSLREPALPLLPSRRMRAAILRSPDYERLPGGRLWYGLKSEHLLGIAPASQPQALRTIFFLQGRAAAPHVEPLGETELLARSVQRLYRQPHTLAQLARIRHGLRHARGYLVRLAEPRVTAHALLETLLLCA